MGLALLAGGPSLENYLSVRSAEYIQSVFDEEGIETTIIHWKEDGTVEIKKSFGDTPDKTYKSIIEWLSETEINSVFNCTHGELENSGQLQSLFSFAGIYLSGSGIEPSVIGMNKILSKEMFKQLDVPTPRQWVLGKVQPETEMPDIEELKARGITFPCMLKLSHGGSSENVELVPDKRSWPSIWYNWCRKPMTRIFPTYMEEFINGKDYCVGIFGIEEHIEVFPPIKMKYPGSYFDRTSKYQDTYSIEPAEELNPEITEKIMLFSGKTHREMGLSGFSRLDFRIDEERYYALEINTHPGLSEYSIIPNIVKMHNKKIVDYFKMMAIIQ